MKRQDGLIICDYHKRGGDPVWHGEVLDDGITFIPGYVVVDKGEVYVMISDDPHNITNQTGVLKNRHADSNGNTLVTKVKVDVNDFAQDENQYHFCDVNCLSNWINESKTSKADTQSSQ